MNWTAASTNTSVARRPASKVASFGSRTLQTPVLDISRAEVPFGLEAEEFCRFGLIFTSHHKRLSQQILFELFDRQTVRRNL